MYKKNKNEGERESFFQQKLVNTWASKAEEWSVMESTGGFWLLHGGGLQICLLEFHISVEFGKLLTLKGKELNTNIRWEPDKHPLVLELAWQQSLA